VHLRILDHSHRLSPGGRLTVSFDDGNYNALGLQTPCVLEWNEDFFAGNSSAISGAKIPTALS
jgi:hypothetical protein